MKRGFLVVIVWQVLSFAAFVFNLTANSSDRWWVNAKDGGEKTFVRAGLWQVCFNMYRHRFDYYGKIYHGCWWYVLMPTIFHRRGTPFALGYGLPRFVFYARGY